MLEIEEWFMIKDLHAQGFSIKAISEKTGFDRRTVRKYLNTTSIPDSKKRVKKESKLDEFKEYIITKLHEGPYTASRLHREIQEMGFTGRYTIVKDFVRETRPEPRIVAVLRYETKPGVQSQVDWSEFSKVEIDGQNKKLYCFNMILQKELKYNFFKISKRHVEYTNLN